ncbi:MAG: PHP domain-containing protein [Treponema sp.]|nr:PHP domain-containing protein [Treponema sp.]
MKAPLNLDLHMHSTVSDGTDSPLEILSFVKSSGMQFFSLTDHDASKGCRIIRDNLSDGDPQFINGVEFSCRDYKGKYHILGYGYDLYSEPMNNLFALGHSHRLNKLDGRIEGLKNKYGFSFPEEEIKKLHELDNPGKPHLGNLMVKYGFAHDKEEAIGKYLNSIHIPSEYFNPEEVIKTILESGGIPVLAHPFFGDGSERVSEEKMKPRCERLAGYGLKGLEAFYSEFNANHIKHMLTLAEHFGLYVTAGSDYHGKNKRIPLGKTNMEKDYGIPKGMIRFLEEVHKA